MDSDNPLFAIQERIQDLLFASTYFADLTDDQVLTEKIGNLEFAILNKLLPLGFGLVITTAEGKAVPGSDWNALVTNEDLNISVITNPTTDPDRNPLEAVWQVIKAVHGQSVTKETPVVEREIDYFRITAHQRRSDAPPDLHVHELHVSIGGRLL